MKAFRRRFAIVFLLLVSVPLTGCGPWVADEGLPDDYRTYVPETKAGPLLVTGFGSRLNPYMIGKKEWKPATYDRRAELVEKLVAREIATDVRLDPDGPYVATLHVLRGESQTFTWYDVTTMAFGYGTFLTWLGLPFTVHVDTTVEFFLRTRDGKPLEYYQTTVEGMTTANGWNHMGAAESPKFVAWDATLDAALEHAITLLARDLDAGRLEAIAADSSSPEKGSHDGGAD